MEGDFEMTYSVDTQELRKAMIDAGITTVSGLAEASGVDRNTIGGILNGKIRPSSSVIEKIGRALALDGSGLGRIFFSLKLA